MKLFDLFLCFFFLEECSGGDPDEDAEGNAEGCGDRGDEEADQCSQSHTKAHP